jgi:DNA-directed RNA polymerase specialized sigma24 family protein
VSGPGQLQEWAGRVLRERIGAGAAFRECLGRGVAPGRARDLAEDAVQQALAQAARIADIRGRFQNDFDHFCNWVRRVAINYVRSVFRHERRSRQMGEGAMAEAAAAGPPGHVEVVREFLAQLTEEERNLLMLPYEEDATLDELAERFLPPDDRTENARRLAIWRRRRDIEGRFRAWLQEHG